MEYPITTGLASPTSMEAMFNLEYKVKEVLDHGAFTVLRLQGFIIDFAIARAAAKTGLSRSHKALQVP